MDEDDLDAVQDAILANALGPASASVDGNSASQHSVGDQLKLAGYIAGQVAADQPHRGLRFTNLVPPGCG